MLNAHFNEIKSKLDRLNTLSDSINSLERQFDEANSIFRETLKCSTDRLSAVARTLGSKSIRYGRIYHAARLTVEQNQSECQRACVQFEQANKDHQLAKKAIQEAEQRLEGTNIEGHGENDNSYSNHKQSGSRLDLEKLSLSDETENGEDSHRHNLCDEDVASTSYSASPSITNLSGSALSPSFCLSFPSASSRSLETEAPDIIPPDHRKRSNSTQDEASRNLANAQTIVTRLADIGSLSQNELKEDKSLDACDIHHATTTQVSLNAAELSEQLNRAIARLNEAEKRRKQSEKQHFDCANRLMVSKANLVRLEREHSQSIRRSQLYFDEARQFNAKLDSVKSSICRISKEILIAKKAYAQTLSELEKFSEDLHENSAESTNES